MVTLPAAMPVTTPAVLTDAIEELLLVHVPPDVPSVRDAVVLVQMDEAPEMAPADGEELTVTDFVAAADPHELVTVYDIVTVPPETP